MDRVEALLDLERADRAAVADDRDGGREDILALVMTSLCDLAAQGLQGDRIVHLARSGLAPPSESAITVPCASMTKTTPLRPLCRLVRELLEPGRPVQLVHDRGRDHLCLGRRVGLHLGVHPVADVRRQRHLERHDHDQQRVGERRQQADAEAHASSAPEKRKPTPRTVWM